MKDFAATGHSLEVVSDAVELFEDWLLCLVFGITALFTEKVGLEV